MAKYTYPAIFTKEDGTQYSISFPDIDGCFTCGEGLTEGMEIANDALTLMLYHFEENHRPIPDATPIEQLKCDDGSFATYISCDTMTYRKKHNNRAVKKTVSIPEWLNEAATEAGINFSQVLQSALKDTLHLTD